MQLLAQCERMKPLKIYRPFLCEVKKVDTTSKAEVI